MLNLIKPEEDIPMFEKMRLRALLAIVHSDGADTAVTKMISVLERKESDGKA